MGLGKTIQMAAFLASLAHSNRLQTTLIAAPASVLGHWVRELRRWYPAFRYAERSRVTCSYSQLVPDAGAHYLKLSLFV